jgi:hypothetical protein
VTELALVAGFSALTSVDRRCSTSWINDFQATRALPLPIFPRAVRSGLFLVRDSDSRASAHGSSRSRLLRPLASYSYVFIGLSYVPGSF